MKKYISIFILICVFSVKAFPPVTHGLVHSTTSAQTLSANIISKMFHWQSAKDMPALSDGTAIDSIQDLSGHNNTISATSTGRPLYYSTGVNGKPAWLFDGVNDYFNIPSYTTRGAVMVVNNLRSNFSNTEGFYGSRSTASPNSYLGTEAGNNTVYDFSPSGNATKINNYTRIPGNMFGLPSMATLKVLSFTTSTGVTDATGFQIGSDRKFGTRWLNGYYCEVMGFSTIPTRKEMDTIHRYLWDKYNIESPILYVQDGNSIGIGVGQYVQDTILKTIACDYRNVSVGGATTVQRRIAAPTSVDTSYGFPYTKNVVFLLEGTNDLLNYNSDTHGGDSCYAHIMTYVNARIAAGWKVVVSTVLSRTSAAGGGAQYEANRVALNTLLTNTTQTNNLKIVDFGQDANLGAPSAYSNTTYFSDGIHPTATGYKLIAKYVAEVIRLFNW